MRRVIGFVAIVIACGALSVPAFASGNAQPQAVTDVGEITFPYTGPEIVLKGFWADVGSQDPTTVLDAYRERIGNIRFEWDLPTWADYDTKLKLMLSAGDVPDLVQARDAAQIIDTYASSGVFLDWNSYADRMPNLQALANAYPHLNYLVDGDNHRYALYYLGFEDWTRQGWWYNKTVLDRYGIEVPQTVDEYLDALRTIKAADAGITPWIHVWKINHFVSAHSQLFGTDESGLAFDDATGKWYFGPTKADSNFRKVLELGNLMWRETLIDPEINTMSDEMVLNKFQQNQWAFTYTYHEWLVAFWKSKGIETLGFEAEPMAPPSVNGKAYAAVEGPFDGFPYWGLFGSANTRNPELLAALMDFNLEPQNLELVNWGIEGLSFERTSPAPSTTLEYVQSMGTGAYRYLPVVRLWTQPSGTMNLQSDLGLGQIRDVLFTVGDITALQYQQYDEPAFDALNFINKQFHDGSVTPLIPQNRPKLTVEEADQVSSILNPINTYISEMTVRFIMGDASFDEWDDFIAGIRNLGDIDWVVDLYNSKPQFPKAVRTW